MGEVEGGLSQQILMMGVHKLSTAIPLSTGVFLIHEF